MGKWVSRGISWMAVLALLAGPAVAGERFDALDEDSRILSDRVNLAAGSYTVDFNTTAAVGVGGVIGTFIRLENQLRLAEDKSDVFLDGFYRITPKKTLQFTWLRLARDAVTVIDESIDFQGIEFKGFVASQFDSTLFKLVYSYSFFNNGKVNGGFAAGLSTYRYKLGLAGDIVIRDENGNEVGTDIDDQVEDLLIPLPTVGIFLDYAIMKRLIFRARVDFLDVSIGDLEGRLLDTKMSLDWYFNKNIGIGFATAGTTLDVQDTGDDPFSANYRYSGLQFYVTGVF